MMTTGGWREVISIAQLAIAPLTVQRRLRMDQGGLQEKEQVILILI